MLNAGRAVVALTTLEVSIAAGIPALAIAATVLGLIVQLRNARAQTEPTILKIGHEVLLEANATLVRERDEARARVLIVEAERDEARRRFVATIPNLRPMHELVSRGFLVKLNDAVNADGGHVVIYLDDIDETTALGWRLVSALDQPHELDRDAVIGMRRNAYRHELDRLARDSRT